MGFGKTGDAELAWEKVGVTDKPPVARTGKQSCEEPKAKVATCLSGAKMG